MMRPEQTHAIARTEDLPSARVEIALCGMRLRQGKRGSVSWDEVTCPECASRVQAERELADRLARGRMT